MDIFISVGNKIVSFLSPGSPDPPFYDIPSIDRSRDARSWWRAINEGIRSPEDRDNSTISKVQWFKDTGGLGHESVVVTVNIAHPAYIAFLSIERLTREDMVKAAMEGNNPLQLFPKEVIVLMNEADKLKTRETLRNKLKEELKLIKTREERDLFRPDPAKTHFVQKPGPNDALDIITRVDISYGVEPTSRSLKAECLGTMTFDGPDTPKFPLRDLGMIVRGIHIRQPKCSLTEHNSYWFARTLVDVIVKMKNPTIQTIERTKDLGGCLANNLKFGRIIEPKLTEISEITIEIENAIQADEKRIVDLWEAEGHNLAGLAQRTAEYEGRLADSQRNLASTEADLTVIQETLVRERQEQAQTLEAMQAEVNRLRALLNKH